MCRGTLAGEDAASPNLTGHGPTPLKCSQPIKAFLPRLKSIPSQSLSLGWEALGSSQDRSYWHNMVSGGSAKPDSQHLEHSLILPSDHSNMQACELLGPIPPKDFYLASSPLFPPSIMYSCAERHKWDLRFRRLVASILGLPGTSRSPSATRTP